jgi:hypothetical protein
MTSSTAISLKYICTKYNSFLPRILSDSELAARCPGKAIVRDAFAERPPCGIGFSPNHSLTGIAVKPCNTRLFIGTLANREEIV